MIGTKSAASRSVGDGRATRPWTQAERRWLAHHRLDGLACVSQLLGRSPLEVVEEADELGVNVPVAPVVGETCPLCGRRMTSAGVGYVLMGVCEACYVDHVRACRDAKDAEDGARRSYDASRQRSHRRARG